MNRVHCLPLAALLTACAAVDSAPRKDVAMNPANPANPVAPWPAAVRALLPALLDDAAQRSGVAPERLRVASAQAVTWPDGSLGCPLPGRMYPQALVPGWRIVIAAAGAAPLNYHAGQRGGWVWCPPERATPALPASPDPRI